MTPFHEEFPLNSGRLALCPAFPTYVTDVVLPGAQTVQIAIPSGARFALFAFDGDVRIKPGTAATSLAWPSATGSDGTGSELNPQARRLPEAGSGFTHLCFNSQLACSGSVSFFR